MVASEEQVFMYAGQIHEKSCNLMYSSPRSLIFLLLILSLGIGIMSPATAAPVVQDGNILYKTTFSDASGWMTNSKDRYFLENSTGRYHYLIEGGTGSYSAIPLPEEVNGPFILEFDVTPIRTDEGSSFRFGIGSEEKDSQKGPLLMAELAYKKGGKLFYLKTVSKENALNLVGSSSSIGGSGPAVRYEDNKQYHIKLTYYAADNRASITVQEAGKSGTIFTTTAPVSGRMEDLTHLFLTSLGDGVPGPQAEGYIDNITLTLPKTQSAVSPTPEPTESGSEVVAKPTLAESIVEETETPVIEPLPVRTRAALPPPPTPSPTPKSGFSPLLLIPAFTGAAILISRRR